MVERREQVLFELAKRNKADVAETSRAITQAAAVALDVERTSIRRLLPDRTAIVCEDDFVRSRSRHTAGGSANRSNMKTSKQPCAGSRRRGFDIPDGFMTNRSVADP
jgi:hypothetical protein